MSTTVAVNPHATADAMWRFILKRRCKVGGKSKPGIYAPNYTHALAVVAKKFNVTIETVQDRLNELGRHVGKWVKYSAKRLFAGQVRRDTRYPIEATTNQQARPQGQRRRKREGQPSRKDMARRARHGNFPVSKPNIPPQWAEFAGAKPGDRGLKRACALA